MLETLGRKKEEILHGKDSSVQEMGKKKALSQHLREGYGGFSVSKQLIERTGTNPGPLCAATAMGTR